MVEKSNQCIQNNAALIPEVSSHINTSVKDVQLTILLAKSKIDNETDFVFLPVYDCIKFFREVGHILCVNSLLVM